MHRAFALWLTLRSSGEAWYYRADIIEAYAREVSCDPRTVRRWLTAGEEIFWVKGSRAGRTTLSMLGKDRVFSNFSLRKPGRVHLIPRGDLLGTLKRLRATLHSCWVDKPHRWASRQTIEHITGTGERTQRHYDKEIKQSKQYVFAIDWNVEGSEARQLPNVYKRQHRMVLRRSKTRYQLYSPEIKRTQSGSPEPTGDNEARNQLQRLFYESEAVAHKRAIRRGKAGQRGQCFYQDDVSKRGAILVKTFDYQAAIL